MEDTIKNISSAKIKKVGRDYHVGDVVTTVNNYGSRKKKIQFDTVTIGADVFNEYPKPVFIDEILGKAKTEKLVLIGGNNGFNKGQLMKYIALNLKSDGLDIKECADFDDFYSLSTAISEETNRSIFILYNLTAEAINFRFREFKSLIQKKDHIILSSTQNTYDSWLFHENFENISWFQIPDNNIYSSETLRTYLEAGLQKKKITLEINTDEVVKRLSKIEQLDYFIDIVGKSNEKNNHKDIESAIEISAKDDYSGIDPWFYSLTNFNKLVVIGLTLFDGAYEGQVFAGFDLLVRTGWKNRNKDLRPIDYEDLIPLKSHFKLEGKIVQGKFEQQQKKIIQIAWRTHKRYILSAMPVLMDIVYDSASQDKTDWDLFSTPNHRSRIRKILSKTFSIIALQSFEDANLPLLFIASNSLLPVQAVAANAISQWKPSDENKIYEVLEMWQHETAIGLLKLEGTSGKAEKKERVLISNLRSAIALVLCFISMYDKANKLSSRVTDLLLKFLDNNEDVIIERMQYAIENITESHPLSMKDILKDKFLQYIYYIGPVGNGLVNAYNNGFTHDVKSIVTEWLQYCKELKERPEEREDFGHRESILFAVIHTLKYIDYNIEDKTISIAESFQIFEELRKNNHNIYVRKFLLGAIIELIETMFYSSEQVNIHLISNIDAVERESIVSTFRGKYLIQREDLSGGDYITQFGEFEFYSWSKPDQRSETPIEKLMNEWKKSSNVVLSQIALESLFEFQIIESTEKKLIVESVKTQDKEEKEKEKKRKEYEKKGDPVYKGEIGTNLETEAFVKICSLFVEQSQVQLLNNIYSVAVYKNLKDEGADDFITNLGGDNEVVKKVAFVYKLFRNGSFQLFDNPVIPSFKSSLFVFLASSAVSYQNKKLLKAFAPLLYSTQSLTPEERTIIYHKINNHKQGWISMSFTLAKNYIILFLMLAAFLFVLYKIF